MVREYLQPRAPEQETGFILGMVEVDDALKPAGHVGRSKENDRDHQDRQGDQDLPVPYAGDEDHTRRRREIRPPRHRGIQRYPHGDEGCTCGEPDGQRGASVHGKREDQEEGDHHQL